MIPANLDITIYRGDDYSLIFRLRDSVTGAYTNLTGYAANAQIRAEALSDTVLATFTSTVLDQTATPGGVRLTLAPTVTAGLPLSGGVWDVEVYDIATTTSPGRTSVRTPLAGTVTVLPEVTR